MKREAIKDLLYKIADDQLILGHRNSEWTGLGPILEEDIAFSSMAQDKIGHSLAFYTLLHDLGEPEPDIIAFSRSASRFRNSQFTELPNGEFDFSLIRHFLYDNAEAIRFEKLSTSSYAPIAKVATKLKGEIKYHVLHANTWLRNLGSSTEEAITRLQNSLNTLMPYALGMFEPSVHEQELIATGIYPGEEKIKAEWLTKIQQVVAQTELTLPDISSLPPMLGGRAGQHTKYLQPLLNEMAEVIKIDPTAEW
ncbi:phenylacetate-CoA oxygenase subunit PaaC [Pontibacter qinzhouensis]|uniref:Phenylacetate-CoA oxygenase subunit PaaC n=1 Tax=Pontibacter qinzhouensis TaxID=2603253 RepID=A0A5C8K5T9_9BACT|nr:1,2-phenylacetyl-CoA epoxidase subunit PaaC [Pontibacter qinzhouensis]TXK44453.1 phenylacetate-CoA oxygenase subunit PaaC [Pontibacter qinzhouensis]